LLHRLTPFYLFAFSIFETELSQATTSGNISFVLMVNKQGQTRLASYYDWLSVPQRVQVSGLT